MSKTPWYAAGLCFECTGCGNCCSGPGEGVIWVTKPEIERIADYLQLPVEEVRQRYMRRIGLRVTIIEEPQSKDCIFLEQQGDKKLCRIYPVRPNQCRTWPFWPANLDHPDHWNEATQNCPGMNRGRRFSREEIEALRKQKKWWDDDSE